MHSQNSHAMLEHYVHSCCVMTCYYEMTCTHTYHLKTNILYPLFLLVIDDQRIPVTAFKVRNVLTVMVKQMKLNPKDYGFHCFRCSGATLALELKVPLENIKIHGHWKSDAIWSYLSDTPKAASVVASAFQQHIT